MMSTHTEAGWDKIVLHRCRTDVMVARNNDLLIGHNETLNVTH